MTEATMRQQILDMANDYAEQFLAPKPFEAGISYIPPSGKVIGGSEISNLVSASLDGWLTEGHFNKAFEARFAEYLGVKCALTTNSGSSANLVALSTLTSPNLRDRALKSGDEVITVAAGFPTTINPILQNNLIPVFVDVDIPTYNIDANLLENALSEKTRAIVIAHTLGNPFDLEEVSRFCKANNLWLMEDCCDALGSTYAGQTVGTFGDIATCSFYPAHHITMGEGGAVFTNDRRLERIARSVRDWGRDCYCDPGKDNTCGNRFGWSLGTLPQGYDHKYTYSHIGYNLKITDMQASVGLAQLDKLPEFIKLRKRNFSYLKDGLSDLQEHLILPEPTPNSDPSWFGFLITLRDAALTDRPAVTKYLEDHKIGSRLLFAGNVIRQPYFKDRKYRVSGDLTRTDKIMNDTFWIGVYPGITEPMMDYMIHHLKLAIDEIRG